MRINLLILLFSFFSSFLFAQYSINDSALVRTTFHREFDKEIINDYLSSKDSNKINAALLSISHSEDTTFVDSIIKINFSEYGDLIAFSLGQIGTSRKSSDFLLEKLSSHDNPFQVECYNAIGKMGDSLTLDNLLGSIVNDSSFNTSGFPFALTNFHNRGVKSSNTLHYLLDQINQPNISSSELFQNLYAFYRIGPNEGAAQNLEEILGRSNADSIVQYTLNCIRKIQFFPDNQILMSDLVHSESWNIRTEAATVLCYYPFESVDDFKLYIPLIEDQNPNVSRTAAIFLKNIKFESDNVWLKNEIENILKDHKLNPNTKGELLISYVSLFNLNIEEVIDDYSDLVESKFIYRLMAANLSAWDFQYDYLQDRIEESNEVELLDLLPAYLALQNKFINDEEYAAHLFKVFQSDKPSSASVIADGFKLPMIHHYRGILQELIVEQIFKNKNNSQFSETIISLANLSYKIDRVFYDSVIEMLSTSSLHSVKKYALEKQGIEFVSPKDDKLFIELWSSAFKYRFAEIETNKGTFTIKLKPEFAPITCGNFISLAEQGFYNGVLFHRVVPDFVIQTGDTTGTGWGGPGYEIVSEYSPLPFKRSAVGVASIGKDTEGSQWFVMHSNFPHLNERYTNWASAISGMDVVDTIDESDRVIKIVLVK